MIAPPPPTASSHSNVQSDGDSDSDWDSDDDFASKKISIKIKPIAQVTPNKISASVDELRATVGTWKSLANINLVKPNSRRHHQSTLQLNKNINNNDSPSSNVEENSPQLGLRSTTSVLLPNGLGGPDKSLYGIGRIFSSSINPHRMSLQPDPAANGYQYCIEQDAIESTKTELNSQNSVLKPVSDLFASPPNEILKPQPIKQTNEFDLPHSLSSSAFYSPTLQLAFQNCIINNNNNNDNCANKIRTPVAFAIQECLNVKLINGSEIGSSVNILGRVKLAVPLTIVDFNQLEENLHIDLSSKTGYHKVILNHQFVTRSKTKQQLQTNHETSIKLTINMLAVQAYAREKANNSRYILLPDIIKYMIGSQHERKLDDASNDTNANLKLNPLPVVAHWFCDLNITKVRVDLPLEALVNLLNEHELVADDIRNLRIGMQVSGGVTSYLSKPEASWSPLNSQLTWSLASLSDLINSSTLNGTTSCLARFNLEDGPTTPADVDLQFSIANKTLSGSLVIIDEQSQMNFELTKQKLEVRTGVYKCEPPCI